MEGLYGGVRPSSDADDVERHGGADFSLLVFAAQEACVPALPLQSILGIYSIPWMNRKKDLGFAIAAVVSDDGYGVF